LRFPAKVSSPVERILYGFFKRPGTSVHNGHRGRMRVRVRERTFTCAWAGLGQFQPSTIHLFPFSFSARLRKSIENYRKMVKI
jgi:hypothetical protein